MGKFLYPLPEQYYNNSDGYNYHGGHSYSGHGLGKLDFTCPEGTEVRSMTSGTVLRTGSDSNGTYSSVWIQVSGDYWPVNVGGNLIIRYYHIQPSVNADDTITQGDILGTVGDPDVTSSQHLHLDFCSDESPTLLKGHLTYNQLTDEQKTCLSTWYGQNTGSSFESAFSSSNEAGGNSNNDDSGKSCWGRCWEVIATEAEYSSSSNNSIFKGTYYTSELENPVGGSGNVLIDCSVGEGTTIKGSIASYGLWKLYGYEQSGGRTKIQVNITGDFSFMTGIYYLDDSTDTNKAEENVIDFYYNSSSNCPFSSEGVINGITASLVE